MQTEQRKNPCRLWIGTSGYSYTEWANAGFYPPGTHSGQMLPLYARIFPITELNFTWYQMPKAAAIERMRQHAPPGFRFAAKLTRTLTHEVDPDQWRGTGLSIPGRHGAAHPGPATDGGFTSVSTELFPGTEKPPLPGRPAGRTGRIAPGGGISACLLGRRQSFLPNWNAAAPP